MRVTVQLRSGAQVKFQTLDSINFQGFFDLKGTFWGTHYKFYYEL